jgi:hypothetical protein
MDAGKARAVMGNHELNALHFHTRHPETGVPLRPHSDKNIRQHRSFLEEFPLDDRQTRDVLAWMAALPLFLQTERFRAVHACWDEAVIDALAAETIDGVLSEAQITKAAEKGCPLHELVETTTKGPEIALPAGHRFHDKEGTPRDKIRLKWWPAAKDSWADLAISVPDPEELPRTPVPRDVAARAYPSDAKPVFFGHYWLDGAPLLQAPNALCLDYSAGGDGPLVAYRVGGDEHHLRLENVEVVSHGH